MSSAKSSNLSVGHDFHKRFQRSFRVLETWSKVGGELCQTYKLKAADNSINERQIDISKFLRSKRDTELHNAQLSDNINIQTVVEYFVRI